MEDGVPVPKRAHITREDLDLFGFTAIFSGCTRVRRGQAHTENCRRRSEEELRGTVKAETARKRVKDDQDKAAERRTKRTKTSMQQQQQRVRAAAAVATQREQAALEQAMNPAGWTIRTKLMANIQKIQNAKTGSG